jgi:hypothetical protein
MAHCILKEASPKETETISQQLYKNTPMYKWFRNS